MNDFKKYIIAGFMGLISMIYVCRLYYLQLVDETYRQKAEKDLKDDRDIYPYRGLIYGRNGELIVSNTVAYELQVTTSVAEVGDTNRFCALLGIDKEEMIKLVDDMKKRRGYASYLPSTFMDQISIEEHASIQDLFDFPGFEFTPRIIRTYPHKTLAHTLGYIAPINSRELERDTEKYYKGRDFVGKSGLEKQYEKGLRGLRGVDYVKLNRKREVVGPWNNGEDDIKPRPGANLVSTIDLSLQEYGQRLMAYKKGSIVAIEPSTGEILSIVTSPTYDPNELTGADYSENYRKLKQDSLVPLYDRAVSASYPPGSTFKLVQALIALQEGIINTTTSIYCDGSLVGDHAAPGYYTVKKGIRLSSNNYFYILYKKMLQQGKDKSAFRDTEIGFRNWRNHVVSFGLGEKLGTDIAHENGGQIPTEKLYDDLYGDKRWKTSTIYSNAIGQGEVLVCPMQMANIAAIIANRGHYYTPHVIREIGDSKKKLPEFYEKRSTTVDPKHFDIVIEAMSTVVTNGTAARARITDIEVCGKTGTVENPHGEDHSVFICFAPRENPKIAVACIVENSGYGGTWAAPIASLMMEKYITGEIKNKYKEKRILEKRFFGLEENQDSE